MASPQAPPARPSSPIILPTWHDGQITETVLQTTTVPTEDTHFQQPEPTVPLPIPRSIHPSFRREIDLFEAPVLPLLLFDDGDTLVYIDPPPENTCRKLSKSSTTTHRIHSEKLLSTGSAYLTKLFHPRCQKRVAKQRGFHQGSLPLGIKYLLDLTPPILEDDAIILLTEISCPSGIRTWASQKSLWRLPVSCVGGKDICEPVEDEDKDTTKPSPPLSTSPAEEYIEAPLKDPDFIGLPDFQDEGLPDAAIIGKPTSLPVEYSPVSHREGIERILHVLEGLSISLDTPSKLWTFFAIAKVFDIATVPTVSGYILSWFYQTSNTKFIEIHPEIAYRVACGIKSSELCRHAFLSLVGDEALLYTIRTADLRPTHNYIEHFAHSRINGFLDDIEVQRIEYASKSFADDLIDQFLQLAGVEMSWFDENPEYQKLMVYRGQCPRDSATVDNFTELLKEFVRYRIYIMLKRSRDPIRSSDAVPANINSKMNFTFRKEHVLQRLIGRSFWYGLLSFSLLSATDFQPEHMYHQTISDIGEGLLAFKGHEEARIGFHQRIVAEREATTLNWKIKAAQTRLAVLQKNQGKLPMRPLQQNFAESLALPSASIPHTKLNPHNQPFVFRPRETENWNDGQSSSASQGNQYNQGFLEYSNSSKNLSSIQPQKSFIQGNHPGAPLEIFDLTQFLESANTYIRQIARQLLFPAEKRSIPIESIDTLSCLSEKQLNLLPLWAGGNDDGSGGAYQDQDIPFMETGGFSTPGPAVHTGSNATTEDSFSDIGPSDSRSTINGASNRATLSHQAEVQSLDSSFNESSVGQVDLPLPEGSIGYMETSETYSLVGSHNEQFNFEMDGADSDSNSTLMGHQSDFSENEDEDMEHPENTSNNDDDNDDHDKTMNDAPSHVFEIVDGRL